MKSKKNCCVDGCNNEAYSKNYCEKHYHQMRDFGTIKRTIKDLNEIIEYDFYAEIILYDKNCEETSRTLIDLEDIDKVKDIKWRNLKGYAFNSTIGHLHRFIMNCPDDLVIDHINHNTLDNRKENLRICTLSENQHNRIPGKNNVSGYVGVTPSPTPGKWVARIRVNYRTIHLGTFNTIEEAIEARKNAEIEYYNNN